MPIPDTGMVPITVLVLDQLITAPPIAVKTKLTGSVSAPLHMDCEGGCRKSGAAFTV